MPTKCCSTLLVLLALGGCASHPLNAGSWAIDGASETPIASATTASATTASLASIQLTATQRDELDELSAAPPSDGPEPSAARIRPELVAACQEHRAIVVRKEARLLELYCGDELAGRFPVSLGFAPAGHKHHEGDGRTPEGEYYITAKYISSYHRSMQLSYPNVVDADRGLEEGQIDEAQHAAIVTANRRCQLPPQNTALGSLLQVHGGGGGTDVGDWTLGCVALDNPAIEQAYAFHRPGCDDQGRPHTVVLILP